VSPLLPLDKYEYSQTDRRHSLIADTEILRK